MKERTRRLLQAVEKGYERDTSCLLTLPADCKRIRKRKQAAKNWALALAGRYNIFFLGIV